jgi:molybdopterin molybdotransferase
VRSFRSIQRQLLALAPDPRSESTPTATASGRVLLHDVVAPIDDPAESRSAMDGYAVAARDLALASVKNPVYLRESGVLAAGESSRRRQRTGEASRIMTGAPLPPGADAVVPVEKVRTDGQRVCFRAAVPAGAHLRRPGENFRQGDLLLAAPVVLRPQEIGLCITAGVPRLRVARKVRVGVLSTGSELVRPATRLGPWYSPWWLPREPRLWT